MSEIRMDVLANKAGQPVALELEGQPILAGPIADRLREVVELARADADHHRAIDPARGRRAALVATHAEMALLVALFGDRV